MLLSSFTFVTFLCVTYANIVVNVFDTDGDVADVRKAGDCGGLACDQNCRRIGFPGGACVNGKCKCDIIMSKKLKEAAAYKVAPLESCDTQQCVKACSDRGFPRAICDGDRCLCDVTEIEGNEVDAEEPVKAKVSVCNPGQCWSSCRAWNHSGGYCSAGICVCY